MSHTIHFEDCYAEITSTQITIGNGRIERTWRIENARLFPTSLRDKHANLEWLARPSALPSPTPTHPLPAAEATLTHAFHTTAQNAVEPPSLSVDLLLHTVSTTVVYRFEIFPNVPALSIRLLTTTAAIDSFAAALVTESICVPPDAPAAHLAANAPTADTSGIEKDQASPDGLPLADVLERLDLSPPHLRLIAVELRDQTDACNELVFEREWLLHPNESKLALAGNLFILENPLTRDGIIFLKEAPLPHARPIRTPHDFQLSTAPAQYWDPIPSSDFGPGHPKYPLCYRVAFLGHGTTAAGGLGYRFTTLLYTRGNRTEALQHYQRTRRPFDPTRDGRFVSNTWGDRSRDSRIQADFVTREIDAGAHLGVDVAQIDDGWQQGRTSNSHLAAAKGGVWEGYYAFDPKFWATHAERFPEGLGPIIAHAKARGMSLGLWFSPDSSHDFANWQRDVATILDLHRTHGVNTIKIDGVKARTRLGEYRLHRFFDAVLEATAGRLVFDLDVTAEVRPGYFGLLHTGPLFIENRYTDFHRYWPHQTLRNIWKLAHYVDPARLRAEFLNPSRHTQLYANDPLAPSACDPAYLFATVMATCPLGWFEVSNLPPGFIESVAPVLKAWREHRAAFFSGTILPIGTAPDGTSWTGFLSHSHSPHAYLLAYRELHPDPTWAPALPLASIERVETLAGNATISARDGAVTVHAPTPLSFIFAKLVIQE